MASLANASLPSEDEDDEDFVPSNAGAGTGGQKRALQVTPQSLEAAGNASQTDVPARPAAKKARRENVAALWEELNNKANSRVSIGKKGLVMSALCREVDATNADPDKFWKRSLGVKTSSLPKNKQHNGAAPKPEAVDMENKGISKLVAKSALAAAKDAMSMTASQMHGKVVVAETRTFGGQSVEVKKVVSAAQAEKVPATKGFDAFLESLDGKKQVNVLDKSRSDWKDHKRGNVDLEEELEVHKKSNDQYLDKVNFLHRAAVKEHEKERNERLSSDVRTRGRS